MSCLGRPLPRLLLCVLCLVALLPAAHAQQAAPEATQVVERLHADLIEAMRDAGPLLRRYQRLEASVGEVFDFSLIARTVLGRHGAALDDPQRQRMAGLLRRLSAASYARNFSGYDGEAFETVESVSARGERRLVRTRLMRAGAPQASFDYLLQQVDGHWRVINVIAGGVSDLSLKRAEYSTVIRDSGIETLFDRIEAQITDLLKESATSG
jgi:phospholipid transport system substrate-binding protein